ncbi:Dihydrofolate synthase / Folylpolyglutamate synthase [methanotrophic endosymbiont of Bathymodiolus azoricus (Menez Gwen)]|jgi:dihydrofolate synthase/folylpolyglutamate synthase|nr:Dihydrofolate synthase / Folylpolyglutamate synthase [methanotrophic endosymbiont of Bathymodiolus azoricus (Menez Gwen)]
MHFDTLKGWLDWQESLHPKSIDLGLDRVTEVYSRLNPSGIEPITITVAGTNGKGSSIAFLEAIYRAQGLRVGSYTSPHILKYNERIKIDGTPVSDALLCSAFERIEAVRNNVSLSYFEFSTLAALDIFSRANLNIQLLEVGLGGRLDAVNIIDSDAAIITSIGIDHTAWLGNTRDAIAVEKAGVFRNNTPAIIGDPTPPQSLLDCAINIDAKLLRIGHEFSYSKVDNSWSWQSGNSTLNNLPLPKLKGTHQYRNAAAVITAVQALQNRIPVSKLAIQQGLGSANLLGRFQLINTSPAVLLDVSHNPQAAQTLVEYLQSEFKNTPVHAVFTMMGDKDLPGVIDLVQPCIKHWYISPLDNPRTSTDTDLKKAFASCHNTQVSYGFTDFRAAFNAAKTQAQADNGLILVFGAFFLVSECLSCLNAQQGESL